MAKRVRWDRMEHAYVTGDLSYKELGKRYGIPIRTLTEEAKKREWVKKRKQFRAEAAAEAIAQARAREVDRLKNVRDAADRMGEVLAGIMQSEKQLHLHTGIVRQGDDEYIMERELEAYNKDTLKIIAGALKDMTQVLRNLYGIQTVGEIEKLNIEKARLELEKQRANEATGDRSVEIMFDGDTAEAAE